MDRGMQTMTVPPQKKLVNLLMDEDHQRSKDGWMELNQCNDPPTEIQSQPSSIQMRRTPLDANRWSSDVNEMEMQSVKGVLD